MVTLKTIFWGVLVALLFLNCLPLIMLAQMAWSNG